MEAQESLAIIEQMIANSKKNFKRSAKYFLLWGWGVFLTMLAQYILLALALPHTYYVWITMPVCAVITVLLSIRDRKQEKVRTYTGDAMSSLWTSMGFAFIILTFIAAKNNDINVPPVILIFYGIGTFTSGRLLEFKPLVIGGLFAFAMSIVSAFTEGSVQFLILAIALFVSYIIPGHLLLKAENHD